MKVQNPDDAIVLIAAFRYALGRATYFVPYVVDFILRNWDDLDVNDRNLIVKEILEARSQNNIGHDCDRNEWERILKTVAHQWCPRCKAGKLRPGKAIEQTWVAGIGDFDDKAIGITMSVGGPGKLIDCLKCDACGHSIQDVERSN